MNETIFIPQVPANSAVYLTGEDYPAALLSLTETARKRIWASYFICSISSDTDPNRIVRNLADALGRAAARGVDVRMIVDNYESDEDAFNSNLVMLEYLSRKGVSVRIFKSDKKKSSHTKDFIVDDDKQVAGSGNLTWGGLLNNRESAILIDSADLNKLLDGRFGAIWNQAEIYSPLSTKFF